MYCDTLRASGTEWDKTSNKYNKYYGGVSLQIKNCKTNVAFHFRLPAPVSPKE